MSDEERINESHISTRRLFDSAWADGELHLDNWELDHLAGCRECQHVRDVFAKQFMAMKPKGGENEAA